MRRLALWVPDWPVASLVVDLPPGAAGAVVERERIVCASMRARSAGVRAGMRLATAQYLCPELILLPRDEDREGRAFEAVLDAFDRVAAGVVCARPGAAWAPALSAARWYGGEEEAARALVEEVGDATGVECFVGIAEGPAAAAAAARASRIVPPEGTGEFLGALPLAVCIPHLPARLRDEGARGVDLLRTLGVATCADLLALGRGALLARFGAITEPLHALAEGRELALPARARVVGDRSAEVEIDESATSIDLILLPVRKAAVALAEELAHAGLSSDVLEASIEAGGGRARTRTWSGVDAGDPDAVVERVRWQLKGWADLLGTEEGPAGGARAVILVAKSPFAGGSSAPLWGPDSARAGVERAAERLQSLLGDEGLRVPRLQGGWDPRTRVRLLPWADAGARLVPLEGEWEGGVDSAPATLLDHPLGVDLLGGPMGLEPVAATARGLLTARPTRIRRRGEGADPYGVFSASAVLAVELVGGPWAIRGRWWEDDALQGARVYARARRAEGGDLLLVERLGEWSIDGIYA